MTFSVTLAKQISTNIQENTLPEQLRMVLTVTAYVGFPDAGIFTNVINTVTNESDFSYISTPFDYDRYNFGVAGDKDYVRVAVYDQVFEDITTANTTYDSILAQIKDTCDQMEALQTLEEPPVSVTISSDDL